MRVLERVMEALKSGRSIALELFPHVQRIDVPTWRQTLVAKCSPALVNTSNRGGNMEKVTKN